MTTTTRLRTDGVRSALFGSGYECSLVHNPLIRPHHTANTYQAVAAHQFFEPLHVPQAQKIGNLLTVPAVPLYTTRTDSRRVFKNLDTTSVSAQSISRILPPITSVDINQLYL